MNTVERINEARNRNNGGDGLGIGKVSQTLNDVSTQINSGLKFSKSDAEQILKQLDGMTTTLKGMGNSTATPESHLNFEIELPEDTDESDGIGKVSSSLKRVATQINTGLKFTIGDAMKLLNTLDNLKVMVQKGDVSTANPEGK